MHLKCSFETENIFTVLVIKCVCVFMRRINQISSIDLWRNFTHVYGSATNPHWVQDPPWSLNGPAMGLQYTKHGPLYIGYIFAFYTTKMGSRDSGVKRSTLIRCRLRFGFSMDPAMVLQYTWHDPLYIGYILHSMMKQNGIKELWGHKGQPLLGLRPTLVLQWTCHGSTIHLTWPFIYWLYFCLLCDKNGIKGLWGHKGQSLQIQPHLTE